MQTGTVTKLPRNLITDFLLTAKAGGIRWTYHAFRFAFNQSRGAYGTKSVKSPTKQCPELF